MFWWFQTPLSLPHLGYWFTHPKGPPKVVFNIKTTTHETLFLTCLLNFNGKLRLVFKNLLELLGPRTIKTGYIQLQSCLLTRKRDI